MHEKLLKSLPVLLALGAASACTPLEEDVNLTDSIQADPAATAATVMSYQEYGTWLYDAGDGACPSRVGFSKSRLFGASAPADLKSYCRYTRLPGSTASPHTSWVPDLMAVVPMQDADTDAPSPTRPVIDRDEIETYTLAQLDGLSSFSSVPSGTQAKLVLIDTVPDSTRAINERPTDVHGLRLAALAEELVCDDAGSCIVGVRSKLALAYAVDYDPEAGTKPDYAKDTTDGGTVGSQSDLALAIFQTVDDWKASGTTARLVINLSLGWNPNADGDPSTRSLPEQAVYDALSYASCNDVLVLAAGGREDAPVGSPGATGALLPAAWESDAQPTNCSTLGGMNRRATTRTTYKPLLYSVSAVDGRHRVLPNSRPGSLSRLAAPGSHLTVTPDALTSPMEPVTGTSAATVVASATAAAVLRIKPGLSAHDAMDVVYDSGPTITHGSTTRSADHYLDDGSVTSAPPVHVANFCEAVDAACTGTSCSGIGAACDASKVTPPSFLTGPIVPDLVLFEDTDETTWAVRTCASGAEAMWEPVDTDAADTDTRATHSHCPIQSDVSSTAAAFVIPQPWTEKCTECPSRWADPTDPGSIGWAFINLVEGYSIYEMEDATISVHFETAGENVEVHYPLHDVMVFGDDRHAMIELPQGSNMYHEGLVHHVVSGVTLDYDYAGYSNSESFLLENSN